MKKLLLFVFLFLSAAYAQSAFVPDPNVLYNIVQTNSGLVVGGLATAPCLQTINQKVIQAFRFVPVSGKTDTYYLKNEEGNYLNKQTTNTGDWWSVIYESATNGTNSEWVLEGDITGFRLKLNVNSLYLASDAITNGSGIYCDKAADNANGLFALEVATVIREYFDVAEKNLQLEIEDDQSYPINISTGGVSENMYATATSGFSITKTVFTPEEVVAASGKFTVRVNSTAPVGTQGAIYFSIGTGEEASIFDSVLLVSVAKLPRFFIENASDDKLVIGNHLTAAAPALTINKGDSTQQFILRRVHPLLEDSLYYMIQDGDYRMIVKDLGSNWDTSFGTPADEAIWKIVREANDTTCSIYNFVTGKALGADALSANSRLYDDKTFTANPTAAPYCEWKIVSVESATVPELFTMSDNNFLLEVEKDFQSYPINITTSGIKETIYATPSTGFSVSKSSFTPEEVTVASGKIQLRISSSAAAGTTGTVVFSHGAGANEKWIDTVLVTSVDKYTRYFIENRSTAGLVIGNDSTGIYPALAVNTGALAQKFLLRPAHPDLTDSLYYLIQDGEYQMMKKSPSNAWDVLYGEPSNEAIWKIDHQDGGNYSIITNFVTGKALGSDTTLVNTRLWDDKVFTVAPTSKPYCDWKFTVVVTGMKDVKTPALFAIVSDERVNIHGTNAGDQVKVYNLCGQVVRQLTAVSDITPLYVRSGVYLVRVNNTLLKVIK